MLVQALILATLTWTGAVRVWHVYLMAFILGMLKAVDMPPRQSFVVEMVEGKEDLTSAIGLNSAIHNSARTLGPAIAGVVIALRGEAFAFFMNSLSFIAVIACLLLMRNLTPINPTEKVKSSSDCSHDGGGSLCPQPTSTPGHYEPGGSNLLSFKTLPDLAACICR